jgi:CubicO group peptidase (beta-lactamase class C family)
MNKPELLSNAASLGFDATRLARLTDTLDADIAAQRYDGAVVRLARGGETVLASTQGFADRAKGRALAANDVFLTFSIAKQFTHALVLAAIDRGELGLMTRVAEVLPEFGCRGKESATVFHILTHTAGLPLKLPPMDPMQMGNLAAMVAAGCMAPAESVPGERVNYSGIVGTAILAEILRRLDGGKRSYRDLLAQELFAPLGMKDTALGIRADLAARFCPVIARDRRPGVSLAEEYEMFAMMCGPESEIPALGCVSTAADLERFAEMLRGRGALGSFRLLSPAMVDLAMRNHTGDLANETWGFALGPRGWKPIRAFNGLGFYVRGDGIFPTPFGHMASPGTYGGVGAGSTLFWVDPARDLTFVLMTTGLIVDEALTSSASAALSDLVFSAME